MMKFITMLLQFLRPGDTAKTDDPTDETKTNQNPPGLFDEILLVVLLIPVIGVFVPQFREGVGEGIALLNQIPDWFSFLIVLGVVSVFGFRKQISEILSNMVNFRKK